MDYITPKEASRKWGISERRIQKLCEEGRIDRAVRFSKVLAIPQDAEKPKDARTKNKKQDLSTRCAHARYLPAPSSAQIET